MSEMAGVVGRARAIADEVLFPRALEVDGADAVPQEHLDLLAREGIYGLVGPPEHGGMGADFPTMCSVVEALASGCLTTAFVWVQHLGALWRTAACGNASLKDAWLRPMCAGERRAGIALAALRPGPPRLVARPVEGGWVFDGSAPWVTGWGRIDATLTAAMTEDGRVVRALVDARDGAYPRESAEAREGATISARRLRLVAANASGTVEVSYKGHVVPAERVTDVETFVAPPAYDGGGRLNGSLALGVTSRCLRMLGASALDGELEERRRQLDTATDETMAAARAAAVELAVRSAAALVVGSGSGALVLEHDAQRLARESVFLLTFGTRPAIRGELLGLFGAGEL